MERVNASESQQRVSKQVSPPLAWSLICRGVLLLARHAALRGRTGHARADFSRFGPGHVPPGHTHGERTPWPDRWRAGAALRPRTRGTLARAVQPAVPCVNRESEVGRPAAGARGWAGQLEECRAGVREKAGNQPPLCLLSAPHPSMSWSAGWFAASADRLCW